MARLCNRLLRHAGIEGAYMQPIHKLAIFVTFLGVVLATLTGPAIAAEKADYVFKNGAIYTIDSKNPTAQAIAITGKHISYVGSNEGVQPFIGPRDTGR